MLRRFFLAVPVLLVATFFSIPVFADQAAAIPSTGSELVKVNNRFCPVSGESVHSMDGMTTIEHSGKEYNLCCKHCVQDFKKDPEKFIAKMESQEADTPDLAGIAAGASETEGAVSDPLDAAHEEHVH